MGLNQFEKKKRKEFLARLSKIYKAPEEFLKVLLSIRQKKCFRIQLLKQSPEIVLKTLAAEGHTYTSIEWCPNSYILEAETNYKLSESMFFKKGEIYIQNASSLLPPLIINPQKNEFILDMCAAPGGKTIHIADLAQNSIRLWANDSMKHRFEVMKTLLERYGVETFNITNIPGEDFADQVNVKFDKILIDAQCSGEGMIKWDNPRALRYWSTIRIKKFSKLQRQFIDSAYKVLKPGGIIVYSTCTFAPEENELVMDYSVNTYPDLHVEEIKIDLPNFSPGILSWDGNTFSAEVQRARRILPTEAMEPFFVCKLKKD